MKSNKFYQIKTLFFLLLMMLVASCSNEMEFENTPAPDNWDGEIVLSMSPNFGWGANSRSESSETTVEDIKAFFQDKCLFMFITANEQNTSLMNEVIGLQYSDDGFKFGNYEKGEDGILAFTAKEGYVPKYPQDSGMDLYFVAISKYSELPVLQEGNALPTINHKISANQKDSNADSDLLYASVKNQSKTATPIVLNFKHLLSKVSIAYQPEEYEGKLVNAVFLENCYDAVNLNLTAGTISNSGTETSIRIRTQRTDDFNTPQYCEAYVAPATYAANSTFIKFCYNYNEENKTSDKVVSYNIPEGKEFVSGYQYKYHMNVYKNGDIVMEDPTIYIYGSAIGENAYNLPVLEAQKMIYDEDTGEYSWTGNISNSGDFKFTCQADAYWPGYVKGAEVDGNMTATYCTEYESSDEPKFTVNLSGEYTVSLKKDGDNNYVTIKANTYSPLYIFGDALQGYDPTLAILMDEQDGVYTYTGEFIRGGFRFICQNIKDQWWPGYANIDGSAKYFDNYDGYAPDFDIYTKGNYTITFDSNKETNNVSIVSNRIDPVYLIGDATPNGWSTASPTPMTNILGTYSFEWDGNLTTNGESDLRFICQAVDGQYWPGYAKASDNTVNYFSTPPTTDTKFDISNAGYYYVLLNTENLNVKIERLPDNVWIFGDATDAGWTWGNMRAMSRVGATFTITTNLKENGYFRFSLTGPQSTEWQGDYIYAPEYDGYPISGSNKAFYMGAGQNTWKVGVGEAGNYTITLDFKTYTISFQKNN